jgi:hypothetical protein
VNINVCLGGTAENPDARPLFVYEGFRIFTIWAEQNHLIPRVRTPKLAPGAGTPTGNKCYGYTSPCRFTTNEWLAWSGWCGHSNVPENTHWDPNLSPDMWDALMGDTPIVQLPPQPTEDDMMLPLAYGDGYNNPPDDSIYAGQNRSHRREDVKYAQQIAGSGGDGYYGAQTSLDFAAVVGSGDGRTLAHFEWDALMDHRYGDNVAPPLKDHKHPIPALSTPASETGAPIT